MFVALRFLSLLLIVVALMLLGADLVSTLEKGGEITVRALDDVWAMFDKAGVDSFKAWLEHTLPAPMPSWIEAVLSLPGWAFFGVIGVILAFLFGRRHEAAE
jgi:hypothetical protein